MTLRPGYYLIGGIILAAVGLCLCASAAQRKARQVDIMTAIRDNDMNSLEMVCRYCPERLSRPCGDEADALMFAIANGRRAPVELLLRAGGSPDMRWKDDNMVGWPLGRALEKHPELVPILLSHDANPNESIEGYTAFCEQDFLKVPISPHSLAPCKNAARRYTSGGI